MQLTITTPAPHLTEVYTLVRVTSDFTPMAALVHPSASTVKAEDHVIALLPTRWTGEEFGQMHEQSTV